MKKRLGSLFSGAGCLDLAVEKEFDARTVWHVENDPHASLVLARHWPGVPNYRDITTVDWDSVEPIDILCGGSPCQDISVSGPRGGMSEGTRSNLWVSMRDAIYTLKPEHVVWENVGGSRSAKASSVMDEGFGLLGQPGPALRALGRVLGDLATLGYDAEWRSVLASDVGACHRRERVFIRAWRQESTNSHDKRG